MNTDVMFISKTDNWARQIRRCDMNTDICDICNKPIWASRSLTGDCKLQYRVKIKSIEEGFSMAGYFKKTRNLDMCPDCMNKFVEFSKEGGAE